MKKHVTHIIHASTQNPVTATHSMLGGQLYSTAAEGPRACKRCGTELSLFAQFDLGPEMNHPFEPGSRLLVFACTKCDDIPRAQYSDNDEEVQETFGERVPDNYSLVMLRPGEPRILHTLANPMRAAPIRFEESVEDVEDEEDVGLSSGEFRSKVGGTASWINYGVHLRCTCGGALRFVCQFAEHTDFPDGDSLFNGNQVFILGCEQQCSPYALIPVVDN